MKRSSQRAFGDKVHWYRALTVKPESSWRTRSRGEVGAASGLGWVVCACGGFWTRGGKLAGGVGALLLGAGAGDCCAELWAGGC